MAGSGRRTLPPEILVGLRRRLDTLPGRHPDRARMVEQAASLYGVSATTLYRQLRTLHRPRPVRRANRGQPRKVPVADLERWCEIIAALKLRTTNKKGRHLSTARALELMEQARGRDAARPDPASAWCSDPADRGPLPAPVGLRPGAPHARPRRGPLPGLAQQ